MNLANAPSGRTYRIMRIETDDASLESFLSTLGCYSGEMITLVHRRRKGCIVQIRDSRYHMDRRLAQTIIV